MKSVLSIRKFMAFTISQAISHFGDQLDYMALLAMIAALAAANKWESSRANSYLIVLAALPTIIFGPLAGVLVDRWNRIKVMFICDIIRGVVVFTIPFVALRSQSLPLIFSVAFCVFFVGLFFNTARLSVIPELIESRNILEANSVITLAGRVSIFLGLLLGGMIVDWSLWKRIGLPETWAAGFYLDSLTFVVSAVTLGIILARVRQYAQMSSPHSQSRIDVSDPSHPPDSPQSKIQNPKSKILKSLRERAASVIHDFTETFTMMRKIPAIQLVLFSVILFVTLGASVVVLLVPIIQTAKDDLGLGVGTRGVGFVGTVGSVGLVLSSFLYGLIGRRIKQSTVLLVCFAVLGLLTVVIALSSSLALTLLLAFFAGLLLAPIYITQDTLVHENVPANARGRVFSTREWFFNASGAVMAFVIGQLIVFIPKWREGLHFPLGIDLDHHRLLLAAIGFTVTVVSLIRLFTTRRHENTPLKPLSS
jgi:MFS transporter, DHA3 family, macrolide efflux protein